MEERVAVELSGGVCGRARVDSSAPSGPSFRSKQAQGVRMPVARALRAVPQRWRRVRPGDT